MLSNLFNVPTPNIDYRTSNSFGRIDHDIVILSHMKGIERLYLLSHPIQNSFINRVRHAIVDQLCQYQSILTFIEHLESICGKRKTMANIGVTRQHCIDVPSELGPFIFIDGMGNVCR